MKPTAWRDAGRYFSFLNHRVFYREQGHGEAVVCLHGFPTASWDWYPMWPFLMSHFRTIAFDMLGFGFSDKPVDADYTVSLQADITEALLKHLGIQQVHVLAHDLGDTVAQELIARRCQDPQRQPQILSVCLLNGGLFPETHRPRLIQKLLISPLGRWASRLFNQRRFQKSFAAIFGAQTQPTNDDLQGFWSLIDYNQGRRVFHKTIRYMRERSLYRERWVGALQTTAIPIRLIDGADDPISGRHMAARYQALVPKPDVIILDGIGHYPQIEAPEQVQAAYLAFIRQLRPPH